MKKRFKKGDLVFVPSSVRLIQFNYDRATKRDSTEPAFVQRHTTTSKPTQALLVESVDNYFKIYYNGEYWFANEEDVYRGEQ